LTRQWKILRIWTTNEQPTLEVLIMSILTAPLSPNNIPLCPACGVESVLVPTDIAGVVYCPRCWRSFLDGNLDGVFVGRAADEGREPDEDTGEYE